jgi:hypothetical protein
VSRLEVALVCYLSTRSEEYGFDVDLIAEDAW